ncbi:MAG: hypothetical protein ABL967_08770, partial [Bryobacteraceae bacterium]
APLEDRLLRANPAQPPKPKGGAPTGRPMGGPASQQQSGPGGPAGQGPMGDRPRRAKKTGGPRRTGSNPNSAFAEELAKAL